jgi:broad specificity phosphatase PhoE
MQASAVGEALKDIPFSRIYASPLRRTRETAAAIAETTGAEIVASEKMIDINFGDWEGKRLTDVQEEYPAVLETWSTNPAQARIPNGENLETVQSRAMEELREIARTHGEGRIAVVSHRVVLKTLMMGIMGIDLARFRSIRQNTACINVVGALDGDFILVRLNDTWHLKDIMDVESEADF